ncbi:MAG: alpha-L-fucosidase [Cyclobacteriaceae bacterium]|nr:alpha-L-fucosidase [Cyclobacteriaceae bacterium HetDA_MAG_MS6]
MSTWLNACTSKAQQIPSYLDGYKGYGNDPLGTATQWFREAKFGLFIHYGLYSLLGRGEWVQYYEKIPVKEYEKLKDGFTAKSFDADLITDLAMAAEMKYVNITTRHHDSFCLFDTKTTDFNSINSPAKRDIVRELADSCQKKGLGLCLYYSHGRDWRHPHAPNNDNWGGKARPTYDPPEPHYKYGQEHDINEYVDYMHAQLTELLTQYGPIASIWLDGYGVPMKGPTEKFRIEETYRLIRGLQPQTLITAKSGYLGTEDYYAPEIHWIDRDPEKFSKMQASDKPIEVCSFLAGWGYNQKYDGNHREEDSVLAELQRMGRLKSNLLLNIAPLPDGAIDPQDVDTLNRVGAHIRQNGWYS